MNKYTYSQSTIEWYNASKHMINIGNLIPVILNYWTKDKVTKGSQRTQERENPPPHRTFRPALFFRGGVCPTSTCLPINMMNLIILCRGDSSKSAVFFMMSLSSWNMEQWCIFGIHPRLDVTQNHPGTCCFLKMMLYFNKSCLWHCTYIFHILWVSRVVIGCWRILLQCLSSSKLCID